MNRPGDADLISARAALLDALEALAPHLGSVVVIGAQAIYLMETCSPTHATPRRHALCRTRCRSRGWVGLAARRSRRRSRSLLTMGIEADGASRAKRKRRRHTPQHRWCSETREGVIMGFGFRVAKGMRVYPSSRGVSFGSGNRTMSTYRPYVQWTRTRTASGRWRRRLSRNGGSTSPHHRSRALTWCPRDPVRCRQ